MAINIGARRSSLPKVISQVPSFNFTPGSSLPVPYPVTYSLSISTSVSSNVRYNGSYAFMLNSDSTRVSGDEVGLKGGVISNTFGGKAEPIEFSLSVFVNKHNAVRCGDLFYMNNKNTQGTLVCVAPPQKGAITDTGKASSAGMF